MKTKIYSSILTLTGVALSANLAYAQTYQPSNRIPVADNTLGTQVSGSGNNFNVTGGLSRGQNLFQSFQDFSVPTNGSVTFTNPAGNRSIITRVTGNLFSDINGRVDTNGANFFLINPNGIVFGNNVQLNVGKSFVGSTANGIDLVDPQGKVYTFGTKNINDTPLLTINPNVFLNVASLNIGASVSTDVGINNYGILQTNNDNQYIGLIGGNITLDGSFGTGDIIARGGRVDLGGLKTAGTVSLNDRGLVFNGNNLGLSDVSILNGAWVDVRTSQSYPVDTLQYGSAFYGTNKVLGTVDTYFSNVSSRGSNVNINANNVKLFSDANNIGFRSSIKTTGGDININATGKLSLNFGEISSDNTLDNPGSTGNINISAQTIALNESSEIFSYTQGLNNAGNISIFARNVDLENHSAIEASSRGQGNAGNINIKAFGDITLDALSTKNQSQSFRYRKTRISGNKVSIETQGKVSLLNTAYISGLDRGIDIAAGELYINNFSNIQAIGFGSSNAGNINIKTTGNITIDNNVDAILYDLINPGYFVSISSKTYGDGSAGSITIQTQGKLSLDDGSISSSGYYQATGNSKDINIVARDIDLRRRSRIASENVGDGSAGNTYITAQGTINIEDSLILADSGRKSVGLDRGGDIVISSERLNLKNGGIFSDSSTLRGGNITLIVRDRLLMQPDSAISTNSTSTQKNGDGGNITISSPLIISTPGNSDISANAAAGSGGRVNIISQGLFGIQFRPKGQDSARNNDITASSTFGQNGTVDINTPGLDPGKDATQLPIVPIDAANQISQTCSPDKRDSNFTVTGRGGLPKNARDLLANDVVWQDPRANERSIARSAQPQSPQQLPSPAIGWVADGKGKITLVAAESQAQQIGTRAGCPNRERK